MEHQLIETEGSSVPLNDASLIKFEFYVYYLQRFIIYCYFIARKFVSVWNSMGKVNINRMEIRVQREKGMM